jgi:hypothetical protein
VPQDFPCLDYPFLPYQVDLFGFEELDGCVSEPLILAAISVSRSTAID